ncbi:hypothetical protein CUV01_14740 [Paracoccus tegillarcae]|uniref:Uncharacterized protein n=1 Tax=Paracoccus tegillarcae TaxID=1529068 RepID=A0A2K9EUD6_9RHOB|nr:hypothetical protein CUV01_14740 [Paracoccus tegillarcae]
MLHPCGGVVFQGVCRRTLLVGFRPFAGAENRGRVAKATLTPNFSSALQKLIVFASVGLAGGH